MFFLDNLRKYVRNLGNLGGLSNLGNMRINLGNTRPNNVQQHNKYNSRSSGNGNMNFSTFFKNDRSRCLYKLVTKEHAAQLIKSDNVILIDVRTRMEYESVHIQNAINIPVEEMEETLKSVNLDKTKSIMVYCSTGTRNKAAIQILNKLGYGDVLIWEYGALATFPFKDMFVYAK